jgi:hypothetical protein
MKQQAVAIKKMQKRFSDATVGRHICECLFGPGYFCWALAANRLPTSSITNKVLARKILMCVVFANSMLLQNAAYCTRN